MDRIMLKNYKIYYNTIMYGKDMWVVKKNLVASYIFDHWGRVNQENDIKCH